MPFWLLWLDPARTILAVSVSELQHTEWHGFENESELSQILDDFILTKTSSVKAFYLDCYLVLDNKFQVSAIFEKSLEWPVQMTEFSNLVISLKYR